MIPGETILNGAPNVCPDCKRKLEFAVQQSAAGYYVGTWCDCGPYSRETEYFDTREEAEMSLACYKETGNLLGKRV